MHKRYQMLHGLWVEHLRQRLPVSIPGFLSVYSKPILIPKVFFEFQFNFVLAVCKTKVTTVR